MMPANPHTCINGFQDVAAIVVAIAILDSTSEVQVKNGNTTLVAALPDAVEARISNPHAGKNHLPRFAKTAGIPQSVAGAVRVYQRYIYLAHSA